MATTPATTKVKVPVPSRDEVVNGKFSKLRARVNKLEGQRRLTLAMSVGAMVLAVAALILLGV